MRSAGLWMLLFVAAAPTLPAAERTFPYAAVIDVDEEAVRSGPGPKYYETSRLRRGDRVTVHRHDPGGWYMISPPAGSFSWIQADYVEKTGPGQGTLKSNQVIVRVGSALSDARDVFQRHLSRGDAVEIIGEQVVTTDKGPTPMLKIKPPTNEYRWIMGKGVVPVESVVQNSAAAVNKAEPLPPLDRPTRDEAPPVSLSMEEVAAPPRREAEPLKLEATASATPANPVSLGSPKERLDAIDNQFREQAKLDPRQWKLEPLREAYLRLDAEANDPTLSPQIAARIDAVNRYAKTKKDYDEFVKVSEQGRSGASETPAGSTSAATSGQAAAAVPKFDGAGIVQRRGGNPNGGPQHVLLNQQGRVLAYLQAGPGVDLDGSVGKSMGLVGPRSFRPDLNGDLIAVQSVHPVILKSSTP